MEIAPPFVRENVNILFERCCVVCHERFYTVSQFFAVLRQYRGYFYCIAHFTFPAVGMCRTLHAVNRLIPLSDSSARKYKSSLLYFTRSTSSVKNAARRVSSVFSRAPALRWPRPQTVSCLLL